MGLAVDRGKRIALAAILLAAITTSAQTAQSARYARIAYTVAMSQPTTHLFEIQLDVQVPDGAVPQSVDLQMPSWQPGRYSVADFAKNVQEFSASAAAQVLPFHKVDPQTWRVRTLGNRSFSVRYKVFGNDLSGTYAQLDGTHANFNGGELFMYVADHKQDPVELRIRLPQGWRAINARSDSPNQTEWRYPNYDILIDTPTEAGADWTLDEFTTGGKQYRVVVHSRGGEGGRRAQLVRDLRRVVDTEVAMWGPPEFSRYTFMFHFAADYRSYDGMEHLESTQIINGGSLEDGDALNYALENSAHEFFHVWNVKRLRPAALGPWDVTRPANTPSLWIAEGLTQYYGNLMMRRAGLWNEERYFQNLEETLDNVENSPGVRLMSAVDSSLAAPFTDGGVHRQQTNLANTSVSYYLKGELIGLVLDLTIRARTGGQRSLDNVFTRLYDELYLKAPNATYYLKGRGYTEEDFLRVLSEVAGTDMKGFYDRHIKGVEPLPYSEALAAVGFRLVKEPRETTNTGIVVDPGDTRLRLGTMRTDSPAARSGLQQGDIVTSIAGERVTRSNWQSALERYRVGDKVKVQLQRYGRTVDVDLEIGPPERFDYTLKDLPEVSREAQRLREGWLGSR